MFGKFPDKSFVNLPREKNSTVLLTKNELPTSFLGAINLEGKKSIVFFI